MKAYVAVIKARLSILWQYRAAALSGVCTQLFWGTLHSAIITAFYANTTLPSPIPLNQAITIIWLSQCLLQLLPWMIDPEIERSIKDGDVAYELIRPVDLFWLWFSRSVAYRIAPAALQIIPVFLVASLLYPLNVPSSPIALLYFIASLGLAALLSGAIGTLMLISLFWTTCGEGIQKLLPHGSLLLSGVALPLPLFPSWAQPFLSVQPFRGIIDIPSRIYSGVIPVESCYLYLCFQVFWIISLIFLGRWLLKRACSRFVTAGG